MIRPLLQLLSLSVVLAGGPGCGALDRDGTGGTTTPSPTADTGACEVDRTYCLDASDGNACRKVGIDTGKDVVYRNGQSCSDLAYFASCPGEPGKYKVCP